MLALKMNEGKIVLTQFIDTVKVYFGIKDFFERPACLYSQELDDFTLKNLSLITLQNEN